MLHLELLPRLIPDSYLDTIEEALEEVEKRRAAPVSADAVTRFVESPYGGFKVFTISRMLAMELLAEHGLSMFGALSSRKTVP